MDKFYSVDELAHECDVTPRTIRLYIEKKLLAPVRVGRSFVFTQKSVKRLQTILRDKCIGFSLHDIKKRLDAKSTDEFKSLIARVDGVISAAKTERKDLSKQLSKTCH
ncbi:MAG: MerR family transcriptional regulator [Magnetovibrio sp.]|nr:MerR family transcriptional regulator [Magnetovibrio sp.]